jgi:hypothetical protein
MLRRPIDPASACYYERMNTTSLDILEKTQLPPSQARAILQVMELELAAREDSLATKDEVKDAVHSLELRIESFRSELKGDIAELKGDIKGLEGSLMRWVLTCIMAQTTVIAGAVYFGLTHLRR